MEPLLAVHQSRQDRVAQQHPLLGGTEELDRVGRHAEFVVQDAREPGRRVGVEQPAHGEPGAAQRPPHQQQPEQQLDHEMPVDLQPVAQQHDAGRRDLAQLQRMGFEQPHPVGGQVVLPVDIGRHQFGRGHQPVAEPDVAGAGDDGVGREVAGEVARRQRARGAVPVDRIGVGERLGAFEQRRRRRQWRHRRHREPRHLPGPEPRPPHRDRDGRQIDQLGVAGGHARRRRLFDGDDGPRRLRRRLLGEHARELGRPVREHLGHGSRQRQRLGFRRGLRPRLQPRHVGERERWRRRRHVGRHGLRRRVRPRRVDHDPGRRRRRQPSRRQVVRARPGRLEQPGLRAAPAPATPENPSPETARS